MPTFYFEREVRTPHSECYTVIEEDQPVGRLDLHFATSVVHATLCVSESLTQENIQELVDMVDEELVDAIGVGREELIGSNSGSVAALSSAAYRVSEEASVRRFY